MPKWVAIAVILAVIGSRVSWFLGQWRGRK
jgi:hypothetical protein